MKSAAPFFGPGYRPHVVALGELDQPFGCTGDELLGMSSSATCFNAVSVVLDVGQC